MIPFLNIISLIILLYVMYLKVKAYRKFHHEDPGNNFMRILFMLFIALMIGVDVSLILNHHALVSIGVFVLSILSLVINTK
jgi:hypothetical protein